MKGGVNKHPYLSISFILFLFFWWFCAMLDWKEVRTFVKKNLEFMSIGVLVVVLFIYSMFSTSHLKVVMKSDNEDFKFEVGVSEWNKKEVLKIMYDGEELVELDTDKLTEMNETLGKKITDKELQYFIPIESKKEKWAKKTTNLVFDVTDSYREGVINDADPKKRFNNALAFLERNKKKYLSQEVRVGFLWAKEGVEGQKRSINKDVYIFALKPYRQGQMLRVTADEKSYIKKERNSNEFHFEDVRLDLIEGKVTWDQWCTLEDGSDFSFDCKWGVQPFVATLKWIWKLYLDGTWNRGTFLPEYLKLTRNEFDEGWDFVIFSDGEFQLRSETHEKTLAKLNQKYHISANGYVYNGNNFTRDSWFANYWEAVLPHIKPMVDFCKEGGNNISLVGLSETDNTSFIQYSKDYYGKLFEGCNVEVK